METKNNETYLAPSIMTVELEHKSVICQSGGMRSRDAYTATDDNPFGN